MDILHRFALLVHWSSFVVGLGFGSVMLIYGFIPSSDADMTLYMRFLFIVFGVFTFFACTGMGWMARFVLSGKIHFLPWKKIDDSKGWN